MNANSAKPHVIVVAGPNGAGKSTAAPRLLRDALSVREFVNADTIAAGLSAFRPESVAIAAGRIMLARMRALATAREDFAFETTLASRSFAPWLAGLQRAAITYICYFFGSAARSLRSAASPNGCGSGVTMFRSR